MSSRQNTNPFTRNNDRGKDQSAKDQINFASDPIDIIEVSSLNQTQIEQSKVTFPVIFISHGLIADLQKRPIPSQKQDELPN